MVFYFALDVRDSFKVLSSLIFIRLWDKILFLKRFLGRFRINRSFFKYNIRVNILILFLILNILLWVLLLILKYFNFF